MGRQVSSARNRPFTVKVILPFDETVKIADVITSMSILALKDRVELVTGIPRYDFRKYKVNAIQKEAIRTSPAGLATLVFVVICHCKSVSSAQGRMVWLSFKGGFSKTLQSERRHTLK